MFTRQNIVMSLLCKGYFFSESNPKNLLHVVRSKDQKECFFVLECYANEKSTLEKVCLNTQNKVQSEIIDVKSLSKFWNDTYCCESFPIDEDKKTVFQQTIQNNQPVCPNKAAWADMIIKDIKVFASRAGKQDFTINISPHHPSPFLKENFTPEEHPWMNSLVGKQIYNYSQSNEDGLNRSGKKVLFKNILIDNFNIAYKVLEEMKSLLDYYDIKYSQQITNTDPITELVYLHTALNSPENRATFSKPGDNSLFIFLNKVCLFLLSFFIIPAIIYWLVNNTWPPFAITTGEYLLNRFNSLFEDLKKNNVIPSEKKANDHFLTFFGSDDKVEYYKSTNLDNCEELRKIMLTDAIGACENKYKNNARSSN